jgi:hypothetical protein
MSQMLAGLKLQSSALIFCFSNFQDRIKMPQEKIKDKREKWLPNRWTCNCYWSQYWGFPTYDVL